MVRVLGKGAKERVVPFGVPAARALETYVDLGCAYCHSQHRNIGSLRRLVPDPIVEMSPADAAARGIEDGAVVEVFNERGRCLAGAVVTRDILAEQQAIADTFFDLKLIPKKLNLLHAAPVDLK